MDAYAFVLGSHPALSVVEIVSYCRRTGLDATVDAALLPSALLVTVREPLAAQDVLRNLGGAPYIVHLRCTINALDPAELLTTLPDLRERAAEDRLLGISLVGSGEHSRYTSRDIRSFGMDLKRTLNVRGLRMVFPQNSMSLTSAQLFHAGFPAHGVGIVLLPDGGAFRVGTVEAVQDIRAYALRDRGRPAVDPGRGMLPLKVAQMLLNLSLVPPGGTVYDPFCGVGTIPMEAWLMGLRVFASDRSPTQVERTQKNLAWLVTHAPWPMPGFPRESPIRVGGMPHGLEPTVFTHDITKGSSTLTPGSIDAVVTEGWLGPARTSPPLPREAERIFAAVQTRVEQVLSLGKALLRNGGTLVITLPAFRTGKRLLRFPLQNLRFHGLSFESLLPKELDHPIFRESARGTLLYGRPGAFVVREIVRLRN